MLFVFVVSVLMVVRYFINRNDQMLQGYVRIVDPVADIADVVEPAVDAMAM